MTNLIILPPLLSIFGLVAALFFYMTIIRQPAESGKAQEIADAIHWGARAFLRKEYSYMAAFTLVVSMIIGLAIGWATAVAFIVGAVSSATAGFIGMFSATRANIRTATAAKRQGTGAAFSVAFSSGAVMGLVVASLGLFCLSTAYWLLDGAPALLHILNGFGMGASSVALFARVGGGIYTKTADVGADLAGKIEEGIPEDDPRNPGVIADNVGDNVGDVAGMGADLFESYCSSMIAAIAIASSMSIALADSLGGQAMLLFLPLSLSALGLLVSMVSIFLVRLYVIHSPATALQLGLLGCGVLFAISAWYLIGFSGLSESLWYAVVAGTAGGMIIGLSTEFFTAHTPVKRIAKAAEIGPATVVINGLAVGMASMTIPILSLGAVILISTDVGGLYGVSIAAVSMLSTTAMVMAVDAYGPVADNAGGIAEMAGMGATTREITDSLDELGNTTAAIGKGFAVGSAALTTLAVLGAYIGVMRIHIPDFVLDISEPNVLVGLFIGGLLPYQFSALTMTAVGSSASLVVEEIRRQFREIPGLREGTAGPNNERCMEIATNAALSRMIAPGLLAVVMPPLIGFTLGPYALGGLVSGALLSGILLGLMMSNAGGAWDNAKKYIEKGHVGGKGSAAHNACIVGDTIGDPFKDTSGPSLNILIKLMAIVSLVIAPYLAGY